VNGSIGNGGQANIYLIQADDGRQLVLKVFKDKNQQKERIKNELSILRYNGHINIVRVIDYHDSLDSQTLAYISHPPTSPSPPGLFLELVQSGFGAKGGTLWDYLDMRGDGRGYILYQEMLEILYQIVKGIAFLHSKGVAHRDIKPENILISVSDEVGAVAKIADFGCACLDAMGKSRIGTFPFFAPELVLNSVVSSVAGSLPLSSTDCEYERDYDAMKFDVWSIGCLVLHTISHPSVEREKGKQAGKIDSETILKQLEMETTKEKLDGNAANDKLQFLRALKSMKGKTGKENFSQMRTVPYFRSALSDLRHIDEVEVDFFERVFEGNPDKRPSASDLLSFRLFDGVRERVESRIYSL